MSSSAAGAGARRRVVLWVVGVLVALLVALGVFVLWLVAAVSGGLDDVFSGGGPAAEDAQVVAAGERAADSLETGGRRLGGRVAAPALAAGSAVVGSAASSPDCRTGQHNFKIDDDFDLVCHRSHRTVVAVPQSVPLAAPGSVRVVPLPVPGSDLPDGTGADGAALLGDSFPAEMGALDAGLRAAGWEPRDPMTMDQVLLGYWVPLAGQPRDSGTIGGDGIYSAGDLPSAEYVRSAADGGNLERRTLSVSWLDSGSPETALTGYGGEYTIVVARRSATAPELLAAVPAGGYAVVLTESVEYFRA